MMKRTVVTLVLIALLSIVVLAFTPSVSVIAAERTTSYETGVVDGRRAANEDTELLEIFLNVAYGFILGPIAVGHSLIADYLLESSTLPTRRNNQIAYRESEYQRGFRTGYLEIKNRNTLALRAAGWAGWIATWLVIDQAR
jgi:hypothetical protein